LVGDFESALTALDTLEQEPRSGRWGAPLLALRAQIAAGLGDAAMAHAALDYLRTTRPGPEQRIEETPTGPVLTPTAAGTDAWLDALERGLQRGPTPEADEAPADPFPRATTTPFRDAVPEVLELLPKPFPTPEPEQPRGRLREPAPPPTPQPRAPRPPFAPRPGLGP
jgi:hypothetical protein